MKMEDLRRTHQPEADILTVGKSQINNAFGGIDIQLKVLNQESC